MAEKHFPLITLADVENSQLPEGIRKPYRRLRTALSTCSRFQWSFAIFGDSYLRQKVLDGIALDIPQAVISVSSMNAISEFEDLLQETAKQFSCIHIIDTRKFFTTPEYEWPKRLNMRRNSIAKAAPVNLVFWMGDADLTTLAKNAPDFWNWRSGVYDFLITPSNPMLAGIFKYPYSPYHALSTDTLSKLSPPGKDLNQTQQARRAKLQARFDKTPAKGIDDATLLLELADLFLSTNHYSEATKALAEATEIANNSHDWRTLTEINLVFIRGEIQQNQLIEARQLCMDTIDLCKTHGFIDEEAQALEYLGDAYALLDIKEQAINAYRDAISLLTQLVKNTEKAKALCKLADVELHYAELGLAASNLKEAITLSKSNEQFEVAGVALRELAGVEADFKGKDPGGTRLEESVQFLKKTENTIELANSLIAKACYDFFQGELDKAEADLHQALALYSTNLIVMGVAHARTALGLLALQRSEPKLALQHLAIAHPLFKQVQAQQGIATNIALKVQCHKLLNDINEEDMDKLVQKARHAAELSTLSDDPKRVDAILTEDKFLS